MTRCIYTPSTGVYVRWHRVLFLPLSKSRLIFFLSSFFLWMSGLCCSLRVFVFCCFFPCLLYICLLSSLLSSLLFFSSNGKIMGTGASSVEELRRTMKKIAKRLKNHPSTKYPVRLTRFRVSNILGSYCFPSPLSLHLLSSQRNLHVDYEPERFPGARVKIIIPRKDTRALTEDDDDAEGSEDFRLQALSSSVRTASRPIHIYLYRRIHVYTETYISCGERITHFLYSR